MLETLDNAKDELKRADHLVYVSLKYTRTTEVIKSVIERLVNAFDLGVDALLEKALKEKKVEAIPVAHTIRCDEILKLYETDAMKDYINLYKILRKILKTKFIPKHEFRRNVAMIVLFEGDKILDVNMDTLNEYFNKVKQFIEFVEEQASEK